MDGPEKPLRCLHGEGGWQGVQHALNRVCTLRIQLDKRGATRTRALCRGARRERNGNVGRNDLPDNSGANESAFPALFLMNYLPVFQRETDAAFSRGQTALP